MVVTLEETIDELEGKSVFEKCTKNASRCALKIARDGHELIMHENTLF